MLKNPETINSPDAVFRAGKASYLAVEEAKAKKVNSTIPKQQKTARIALGVLSGEHKTALAGQGV